jgi:hypothetical protein
MLVVLGGLERTASEYRAILDAAGLALNQVIPTAAAVSIIVAIRAEARPTALR